MILNTRLENDLKKSAKKGKHFDKKQSRYHPTSGLELSSSDSNVLHNTPVHSTKIEPLEPLPVKVEVAKLPTPGAAAVGGGNSKGSSFLELVQENSRSSSQHLVDNKFGSRNCIGSSGSSSSSSAHVRRTQRLQQHVDKPSTIKTSFLLHPDLQAMRERVFKNLEAQEEAGPSYEIQRSDYVHGGPNDIYRNRQRAKHVKKVVFILKSIQIRNYN